MKTSRRMLLLLAMVFSFLVTPALAEEAPKPITPISGPFGPSGTGFPVKKFAAVLNYRHIETDGVRHHGDEVNDNVKLTKDVFILKTRYGILPGLDVRTATPLYTVKRENHVTDSTDYMNWIGDTTVILKKQFLNQAAGDPLSFALDLGAVFPTANVDSKSSDFIGNDAWGGLVGLGFTYALGSNRFDQEFNFATFTEGAHDYRKPNRFRCNTSWAYALNNNFDIGVESLVEWNDESEKNGARQGDSKLEWYAGPKFVFKYKPWAFNLGTAITFPVKRWYEGSAPSDEYRFEVKVIKLFDLG